MPVYLISNGPYVKIGVAKSVRRRLAALQTASAAKLTLLGVLPGGRLLEQNLHARYASKRVQGEWFALTQEDLGDLGMSPRVKRVVEIEDPRAQATLRSYEATGNAEVLYLAALLDARKMGADNTEVENEISNVRTRVSIEEESLFEAEEIGEWYLPLVRLPQGIGEKESSAVKSLCRAAALFAHKQLSEVYRASNHC